MFVRSIFIPTLLVCAIAAPFLLSQHNSSPDDDAQSKIESAFPGQPAGFPTMTSPNAFLPSANSTFPTARQSMLINTQNAPVGEFNPAQTSALTANPAKPFVPFGLVSNPTANASQPFPNATQPLANAPQTFAAGTQPIASEIPVNSFGIDTQKFAPPTGAPTFTPDTLAAQTTVFPGNQFGPDLTAQPLEFLPITDLGQIFRFDISQEWVTRRWKRVSTNHGDDKLHGFRVALVTGTNSWDLHGSLTYYFDDQQRAQRITYRGWTGDATRLIDLLTNRYDFKPQKTHLAGFYLAKSWGRAKSGILMKHPDVIYQENPSQRLGIVLEINNPAGSFSLSPDFQSLIDGSHKR